ncbi:MAG: hypothetical protein DRG63_13185 [Deltaproteobacteria bacterium]|nr:MAG: hypothetical protein DRG63_13185 [Deltaproteobacteria bacterium]
MHQLQKKSGFTLLEVLVSLVILGVCFGVLFETLSQSKRLSWKSNEAAEASRVVHNLLASSEFVKRAMEQGTAQGIVRGEAGWHYWVEVRPLELGAKDETPAGIPGMLEIRLCVSPAQDPAKRRFCLTRWYRE